MGKVLCTQVPSIKLKIMTILSSFIFVDKKGRRTIRGDDLSLGVGVINFCAKQQNYSINKFEMSIYKKR